MRTARGFTVVLMAMLLAVAPAAQFPAVSWTCPMHPEVLEDKHGTCNICGMDLEPVRVVTVYTCPVHAVIEQSKPGKCRICARDLVQMTASLTFTCADNREVTQIEPGRCADGSATIPRYTQRSHGDHNPKHGGIFFMAPDSWHHLEGTYPVAGRFRVYLYDDYSKPLRADKARQVRGRVVVKEDFDPKTGVTRELTSVPLVLARGGAFLEARTETLPLPAKLTAKIAFTSHDKESRFDFTFPTHTKDQPTRAFPSAAAVAPAAPAAPTAPVAPDAPDQLLVDLRARQSEVASLVKSGELGAVYAPALQAKDIALEIQKRSQATGSASEDAVEASVRRVVLAAYQLDSYGDIGDGPKVQEAFAAFNAAVTALDALVGGPRR